MCEEKEGKLIQGDMIPALLIIVDVCEVSVFVLFWLSFIFSIGIHVTLSYPTLPVSHSLHGTGPSVFDLPYHYYSH